MRPQAVLLDALGTLVALEPPAPRLQAGLQAALGVDVGRLAAARAIRAEIAYYRAHFHEAPDLGRLADLRMRCAALVRDELDLRAPPDAILPVLLEALRFVPFADTKPALRALRLAGVTLVVVSNWDVSLHEMLAKTGLRAMVDGAIASAEAGSAKPDSLIFARALALAGAQARLTWHVGDSLDADVEGARRAGIEPVLIDRARGAAPAGVRRVTSLAELPGLIRAAESYPCGDGP